LKFYPGPTALKPLTTPSNVSWSNTRTSIGVGK
jgi:hypothetical protein